MTDLKTVVSAAARFADGKHPMLSFLRFRDGVVVASDGETSVKVELPSGVVVPDSIIHAAGLKKVLAAAPKGAPVTVSRTGPATVGIGFAGAALVTVPAGDVDSYPVTFPAWPQVLYPTSVHGPARRVLHAVAKAGARAEITRVHVGASWAEATDEIRIARAPHAGLPWGTGIVVPSRLFEYWPRTSSFSSIGLAGDVAVVWVGGETRWAKASPSGAFFDLSPRLDAAAAGCLCRFGLDALKQAVKWAIAASPHDAVELVFSGDEHVVACGVGVEGGAATAAKSVERIPVPGAVIPARVVVRGRPFLATLNEFEDEHVDARYAAHDRPITLFGKGGYVEAFYPLCLDPAQSAPAPGGRP